MPQVKKRQQNLEYEFKQLKVKASNTGEEGLNKIKEGFPYYSIFDQTIGYRDSVDPARKEIESSSFMPSTSNADSAPQIISSGAKETEESAAGAATSVNEDRLSTSVGVKRGCKEMRGKESRKTKRGKSDEANGTDDLSALREMWEKSNTDWYYREQLRFAVFQVRGSMKTRASAVFYFHAETPLASIKQQ